MNSIFLCKWPTHADAHLLTHSSNYWCLSTSIHQVILPVLKYMENKVLQIIAYNRFPPKEVDEFPKRRPNLNMFIWRPFRKI